jgi:sec-independent protein translocase protein TatC
VAVPSVLRRVVRRRPRPEDGTGGTMSLRDHLTELRSRLIKALLFVAIGAVIGWILYPQILDLLKEPYCKLPADRRFNPSAGAGQDCQLAFFGPLDGFVLRLKVGVICGIILSSPFWLYQLWAFVTPGLRRHERRWTTVFVFSATLLFLAGAVLSYFTIGKALALLVNLAGSGTVAVIAVPNYVGFVTSMLLVFGAAFELPLLVSMLNLVGVLPASRLIKWQRMAIFLIFVFAAVATPSQDPISMCMLAIPMSLLFELSVLLAWLHDRRKARREAESGFGGLSDDEISPLDTAVAPVDTLDPVDPPRR